MSSRRNASRAATQPIEIDPAEWRQLYLSNARPGRFDLAHHEAGLHCVRVYPDLLEVVAGTLDEFHDTAMPSGYWQVMAGFPLALHLYAVAGLSLWVDWVAEGNPDPEFSTVPPAFVPRSHRSLEWALRSSDDALRQLASAIIRSSGLSFTDEDWSPSDRCFPPTRVVPEPTGTAAALAKGERTLRRLLPSAAAVWVDASLSTRDRVRLSVGLRRFVSPNPTLYATPTDRPARWGPARERFASICTAVAQAGGLSRLGHVAVSTLAYSLPTSCLEEWGAYREAAHREMGRAPSLVVTTLPNPSSLPAIAEARRNGARLIHLQHGGNYGEVEMSAAELFERRVSSAFFSWGWSDAPDAEPVCAFRLRGARQSYRAACRAGGKGPDLLYVPGLEFGFELGVGAFFEKGSASATSRRAVLESLGQVSGSVAVRLHPKSATGASGTDELERHVGALGLALDPLTVPIGTAIARSRLVLLDQIGSTTLLECLVTGHPVLVVLPVWPERCREVTAEPLRQLLDAGVIHIGTDGLTDHLARVLDDVDAWNRSAEVEQARARYRAQFARLDDDPIASLADAISEWVRGSRRSDTGEVVEV